MNEATEILIVRSVIVNVGLFVSAYLIAQLCVWVWAWIDDAKPKRNPVNVLLMRVLGYKPYPGENGYYKGETFHTRTSRTDGDIGFGFGVAVASASPFVVVFYEVSIPIAVAIGLAFTARFSRRLSKRLKAHEEDKSMHNPEFIHMP